MSDSKFLSDSMWKDLSSKHKIKDPGLQKSLLDWKKVGDDAHDQALSILDEVLKQAGALKKAKEVVANPAISKHIAEVIAAADDAKRKTAKAAAESEKAKVEADKKSKAEAEKKAKAEAEAQAKKKDKEDEKNAKKDDGAEVEEDEEPALLTTKLIPLLRNVKGKGEKMEALIATTGKQAVVLLSRKPISPARRKLLKDELGGAGGIKYIPGHCIREHGKVTFVLEKQVSGMRKQIEAALLQQTTQRIKVKCRTQDGEYDEDDPDEDGGDEDTPDNDETDDDEAHQDDADQEPSDAQPQAAGASPQATARQAAPPSGAEAPAPAPPRAQAQATGQAPAPAAAAAAAAAKPQPATAAAAAAGEVAGPPPTPQQMVALEDRRRQFKQARAAWVGVKARAEQDLEKVKDGAHMAYMADPAQFPKVVAGCKAIDEILDNLDDELRDTLDQYASTPLRNQRKLLALADTARATLDRYQAFVAGNALMKAIDDKEFADVTVHAPVMKALAVLRKALG